MKYSSKLVLGLSSLVLAACEPLVPGERTSPEYEGGTVASMPTVKHALKIPDRQTISVPDSGVELGMGWDSRRGEIVPNKCLDFASLRSTGQTIDMELSEVSDQSEMMEKMNVSASVSARSIFASGSAKTKFAKSSKMTSDMTTLLLRTTVNNGVLTIAPPAAHAPTRSAFPAVEPVTLPAGQVLGTEITRDYRRAQEERSGLIGFRPEIRSLLGSPDRFRESCGDYFVASIYSGAELFTTYGFRASSAENSKKVSAEIKADVGMVKAAASGGGQTSQTSISSALDMSFIQIGGGAGMIPMSKDDLNDKLKQLAIEADLTPKFHTMEIRSYREIPGASELIYGSADAAFEVVSDYYWFLATLTEEIEYILDNPGAYYDRTGLPSEELNRLHDDIILTRRALAEVIDAYLDDRKPDPEYMDAVNYQWFDVDTKNDYVLDFDLPPEQDTEPQSRLLHPCSTVTWFDCVIRQIEESVPYGNPNTLKLLLPLSKNAFGFTTEGTATDKSCVDQYTSHLRNVFRHGKMPKALMESITEACQETVVKDPLADESMVGIDTFKYFVLEHNIARQSRRVCSREPRDNECLTNDEIAALVDYVPVPAPTE